MSKLTSQVSLPKSEIAFVDPGVSHLDTLLQHLRPEVDAIVLERARPVPAQMAEALRGRSGVAVVHVIAHGRPGELSFGSGVVSLDNLDVYDGDLAEIGRALGRDGSLRLWSCDTGAGASGAAFVQHLEHATGVAVAAASHAVGAAALGGRWRLDARSRDIDVAVPLTAEGAAAYPGLLGPPPASPGSGEIIVIHNGVATGVVYGDIQTAINAASAGDTIEIGAGLYNAENITVNTNNLTIENAPGAQVTIEGIGGSTGALNIGNGVSGVTIKSSDGVPGNFIVEGSQSTGQDAALYLAGTNGGIKIDGITVQAAQTGNGGLYAVQTGTQLSNILFENNVFTGTGTDQLVDIQGSQAFGQQNGNVNFNGNTFSGSSNGSLLDMTAPGEVINNTFSGASQTTVTLNQSGVAVTGNTFSPSTPSAAPLPTSGYFIGDGSYDPQAIAADNNFPQNDQIYVVQNGVRQDGLYTSIQAAIDAAVAGDTVMVGIGTYGGFTLANGVNVEGASQTGVIVNGTITTPANFDNTTVSNLTVNDYSSSAMLLDMTQTQEVTSSSFNNVTFNMDASSTTAATLIGNGQNASTMALNGTGLTFSGVTANSNNSELDNFFAYFLYSSTGNSSGGPQLVLDDVNLNGDAAGPLGGPVAGINNLVAQWNMSSNGSQPASVTIENSSTSGGGNFYVSGMDTATITDNTFTNQGVVLNGVSNATVSGNTFQDIDATFTPGNIGTDGNPDYEHPGLAIENAWGAPGDSNISITGNTFSGITVPNGAIAFENFTDGGGDELPATISTLNNITIEGNTFTLPVNTPIYVDPQAAGGLLPSTIGDQQVLIGTSGNDSLTAPVTGNTDIFGGGGVDTVSFGKGYSISISNDQWVVSNGTVTDTLTGIDKVLINNTTYDLVDHFGATGGFQSIQAAVNDASVGDTVLIAPGTYAGATITEALTIDGWGSGQTIINTTGATDGLNLTGNIGANATVSISNIGFIDNEDGIEVHSSTELNNLIVNDDDFKDNAVNGVGMGNGAPELSNVTIENSTFEQNGNGSQNGDGDISLFGFLGGATLENLVINGGTNTVPTTSNADFGIQIAGYNQTTDDVTQPIGNVVFNNVQVDGTYDKVAVFVQGYTNLNGLSFQNTGSGGTVINGNDGWGEGFYLDPTADMTPVMTIPGNGKDEFQTGGAGADNVNLSNVSVTNGFVPTAGSPIDTVFKGTPESDTISGLSGGNNVITGDGGIDTLKVSAGYTISINAGHWIVSNATTTDTLSGIDKVVIGNQTYDLVDKFGPNGGFQSLQTAIDNASSGDTILVAPGSYTESANYDPVTGLDDTAAGPNPVGLLVDQSVSIEGVDSNGNVITSAANTKATIISSVESNWGTNFYITAPGVTISGLTFQATDLVSGSHQGTVNKAIEDIANAFTLENSVVDAASGVPLASSVYIDDPNATTNPNFVSTITSFDVSNNVLDGDFVEASGVGFGDPAQNLSLQFKNNEFSLNAGTTADSYAQQDGHANLGVILNGDLYPTIGWDLAPVVDPTLTGNTIDAGYTESPTGAVLRARDDSASNLPSLSYIQNYVANNSLGTYAYDLNSAGTALDIQTGGGFSYYYVYTDAGDASASGAATAGDLMVVQSGANSAVQTIQTNNLTIEALSGSTSLDLSLGSGVTSIALADYATGKGASVTVTGNNSGDTITGNDGSDTLTGGTGNDSFIVGSGNNSITGDGGSDTVRYDATLTASDFTIVGNQWQVSDGSHGIDTLAGIQQVTDGTHTFLLVGDGGYATIQAAVNAASAGDTILIAPGDYAGAMISEELTIIGSGDGSTVINSSGGLYGLEVTGNIDATDSATGKATVTIQGIGFTGNQVGVRVASNTVLNQLTVENSDFSQNTVNGVGMGSGAPGLANISVLNSTFEKNGSSQISGSGDISLFEFVGNALLQNLTVSGGVNADEAIQINGRDANGNVNNPIGNVTFDNVSVTGSYKKVLVYIQGYTNLNGLDFANSGHGGTVINGSAGWGYGLYLDPTAGEGPSNFNTNNATLASDSVNLTNVSVTNSVVDPTAGEAIGTLFNGLPQNDTISGLSGGYNFINGAADSPSFSSSGVNTVDFTEKLTAADFQMVNGDWVVTTATEGTDILQSIEVVNDGAGDTFLLVGGGSTYTSPNAAFTSVQHSSADIIIDTPAQDGTPVLTVNNGGQYVGEAGASAVAFSVSGLDDDESGTLTFSDGQGDTVTLQVVQGATLANRFLLNNTPVSTINLTSFKDGTITATLSVTDTAGNSEPATSSSITLDRDVGEQAALSLTVTNTDVGKTAATAVPFTIAGLDSEDTGTVTFTDSANHTVTVNVTGTQTSYTANLSTLADGAITSSLAVTADPAGNTFTPVTGTSITLDRDAGEQAALTLTVTNTDVGKTAATAVPFTIAGLDSEDTGTVTFTDSASHTVTVNVTGTQTSYTANLSTLADGAITSSLAVTADPAGNTFTPVTGTSITLDRDIGEQAALTLTVTDTDVGKTAAAAVPFTIAGLDSEDTGTVTFTDSASHTVTVNVTGMQSSYFANLSTLNDGAITSSLAVTADPAGNTFTPVTGTSITLDTVQPTLTTPQVVGTAQEEQTLTASANPGQSDDVLSFAWYSSADNFTNPIGTGSTYQLKQSVEGHTIEVKVTATNQNGSTTLASTPTGTVIAAFPTVTPTNSIVNVSSNTQLSAASLFTAADPDGSTINSYEVENESTGSASGFWTLNGVVETNGTLFTVTAAQLSLLTFTAGSSASSNVSDTLEVAAADTAGLGSFATFTVLATQHAGGQPAPVVTASSETVLPESNLAASNIFSGTAFGGFTVQSYEVEDTTANSGSWIFNGVTEPANQIIDVTAAELSELSFQTGFGTDTLMVRANDGNQWGSFTTFSISPKSNAAPPAGTTTVLDLEKTATGVYEYYDIGRNSILQAGPLAQISTSLSVVGIGGFDGSDTADLLTRNTATGAFTVFDVSNNNVVGNAAMGQVGPEWQVAGFGDFSGNSGETDMLMRDTSTGAFEVYDIRNNAIVGAAPMGQVGPEWQVAGFGDFSTKAGETDMMMRDSVTGAFEVYDISHNQLIGAAPMGQVGPEWQVLGFGDFSGNANETDMLMQNTNSGAFEVYDIRNNQIVGAASMGQVGLAWTVAGFADFSGNANETDMLMRNSASGAFELYDISKNTITSAAAIGSVGPEWQVAGVAADPPPSAAASTVLSGQTNDPANGASISQLTQAMASIAPSGGTSTATSPLGQPSMPTADVLATTTQDNRPV